MSTTLRDSSAYSIGKAPRSKLFFSSFMFITEAEFVNPKRLTNVPGPGSHNPNDVYTTKVNSS
jgi:hypothetical protein